MKIGELFDVKTGRRIIEEDVYGHQGNFPCVTSQTANKGITWYADQSWIEGSYSEFIVNEDCITWTKDGAKCGTMFYRNYSFYPNDHCGVLIPKPQYRRELNLIWFIYQYQDQIQNNVNQKGSQGMLYNEEMSEIEVEYPFPDRQDQDKIVEMLFQLDDLKDNISRAIKRIDAVLNKELDLEHTEDIKIGKIALLNKGSNKVSEEMIYLNYDSSGVPVYSSATENDGIMGKVTRSCYDSFDKKGNAGELTWTTNGYAGAVFFRESEYLYSEKCGRIVIRKEYQELINPKYLYYILNQVTYRYKTSESNNGKLDIVHMSEIPIPIPLDEMGNIDINKQKEIVELYDELDRIKKILLQKKKKIEKIR